MSSESENTKLFFTTLHEAIEPRAQENNEERRKRIIQTRKTLGSFAEALLFTDQIVLNIGGPNLELALLVNELGYKNIRELITNEVIKFSFCPGTITYLSKNAIKSLGLSTSPGITRIFGVDPEFNDVFESANKALMEQTGLNRGDRRALVKQVYRNTKILPDKKIFEEAQRLSNADIKSKLGLDLGFSQDDSPEKGDFINEKERTMIDIVNYNVIYLSMAINKCDDLISTELGYKVLQNRVVVEPQYRDRLKISENIFSYEQIPNIKELYATGMLCIDDILRIRKSKHLREFRKWIGRFPQGSSDKEVIRAYRKDIENKISSKPLYKILKIIVFTGVDTALGVVGGIPGMTGGVISNLLLGFGDTFFVDRLVDGWNPKIFIDKEISKKINN